MIAFLSCTALVLVFSSVLADWLVAPENTVIGGWLGKMFNFAESGTGKLALNAKEIILPNNANSISQNKQIPTKEYVDKAVSAATSEITGGGGELECVSGERAHYVCGYIDVPGYTRIDGYQTDSVNMLRQSLCNLRNRV